MSRSLSIDLYLRHFSITIYGKFNLYCLFLFKLFMVFKLYNSGLYIMHYILEVLRYTNIAYIGMCLVLTYAKRIYKTVCYFLSYFCWSISCMSQVSKFHNFSQTCSETGARFIFEGFQYCHLWKVKFQLSSACLAFLYFSFFLFLSFFKLLKSLVQPPFVSQQNV